MRRFFKINNQQSVDYQLSSDMHAHWLPGLDDGPTSLEETLAMLGEYNRAGIFNLVATPHINRQIHPNTAAQIQLVFEKTAPVIRAQYPDMKLSFAAEYFVDEHFDQLLQRGEVLCFKTNHILVEQGFISESPQLVQSLFQLKMDGYRPVLAHPERYAYYHSNEERLFMFRDSGIHMQLNLLSITGKYGRQVAKIANSWLDQGLYTFVGSDAHHVEDLKQIAGFRFSKQQQQELEKLQGAH